MPFSINPEVLRSLALLTFLILIAFFGIVSVILHHHWKRYELNQVHARRFINTYFSVSALLILLMGGALAFIFLS